MFENKSFWICVSLLMAVSLLAVQAYGPNVCSQSHIVTYTEQVYKSYTERVEKWSVWELGTYYEDEIRHGYKPETRYRDEPIYKCCSGYTGDISNCKPVCSQGCLGHSYCSAPQTCSCQDGYGGPNCQPICTDCGKNEFCQEPNVCACLEGYGKTNNASDCVPQCEQNCGDHSFCAAPEICECEVGYLMSPSKTCEPQCSLHCLNGKCSEAEICVCNEGYRLKLNSPNICEPVCRGTCENGDCLKPDLCICHNGYVPNLEYTECRPHCETTCVNATCTGPNQCTCLEGFQKDATGLCKPQCKEGCENGVCVEPEVCVCQPGYEKQAGDCILQTSSSTEEEDAESTTLAATSPSTPSTLILPLTSCTRDCQCWSEQDDMGSLINEKCAHICLNHEDQPCLNLSLCHCTEPNGALICQEGEDSSDALKYECKVRVPKNQSPEANSQAKAESTNWLLIAAISGQIYFKAQ